MGIESPGVTAALPLARRVAAILVGESENEGWIVAKKQDFDPVRKPIRRFAEMSMEEKEEAIQKNPDYGASILPV